MGLIDNIKDAVTIVQKADNIDLYKKLLDLQKEAMDLVLENHELKNEIKELKNSRDIGSELVFKGNNYYFENDGKLEGPYCSTCWDNDRKLIRMHSGTRTGVKYVKCHVCKFSTTNIE